jgi:hypothetical protein
MDEKTKKDTRQLMQKNDNAPCNNQPKEPKERKTKRSKLQPRNLSPEKIFKELRPKRSAPE